MYQNIFKLDLDQIITHDQRHKRENYKGRNKYRNVSTKEQTRKTLKKKFIKKNWSYNIRFKRIKERPRRKS